MILDDLSVDLDIFLYELNENYEIVGREPLSVSQNVGLATEVVTAPEEDTDRLLLLGIDRVATGDPQEDAKDSHSEDGTILAGAVSVPVFLPTCSNSLDSSELENGCVAPISASESCPESYSDVLACGPQGAPGSVILRGKRFAGGALVQFGSIEAECAEPEILESHIEIRCVVPTLEQVSERGETVSITVFNPDGFAATLVDGFTYLPPRPTLYGVTPAEPIAGGTEVSIRGLALGGGEGTAPRVKLSLPSSTEDEDPIEVFADEVVTVSSQQLTARIPECMGCAVGTAELTIVNPDGQESINALDFRYTSPPNPPPEIASLSPAEGTRKGGTLIELSGVGFADGMTIRLGGTTVSSIEVVSSTSARFTAPPGIPGTVRVTVLYPDGQGAVSRLRLPICPGSDCKQPRQT